MWKIYLKTGKLRFRILDKVQNHIPQYTIKNIQLHYNIKYKIHIARYTQYTMYN